MAEWKKCKIGDFGCVVTGKTPSTKIDAYWSGDVPFITPGDLQLSKHILTTARNISENGKRAVKGATLPKASICVSCIGVLGYVGMTTKESVSNQQINSIIPSKDFDNDFVYYRMCSMRENFKLYEGASSVVSLLNKSTFADIESSFPPLPTQRKIAAVLGAIDDKIETNRKICANLEAQAQALFKSWFVDFEPFGGKMPKGWKVVSLGECCNTVLGGTPSRNESTYWGGDIAWINSGKVNDFRIIEASEFITRKGLDYSAAKLMPAKTVVIAITGATLGQVSLLEIEASANQSVIGIIENEEMPYEFIYPLILSRISDLVNCQTGGAQQHINKNDVNGLRFVRPDKKALAEYKNHVSAAYELIAKKCFENRHLEDMRDALLPKLMSGEIDVSKVEVA